MNDDLPDVFLRMNDIAAVLCVDGNFACMWVPENQEFHENADHIVQTMCYALKEKSIHKHGIWLFYISEIPNFYTCDLYESIDEFIDDHDY